MPTFTLGRLAKLYGLHRSSVYEAVAKGRVSAGLDGHGRRVVDLSEAIRVWGEPPGNPTAEPDTRQPATMPAPVDPTGIADIIAEAVARAVEPLREEVAQLRQALMLLEHLPASRAAPKAEDPPLDAELAEILDNMKARRDKR